MTRSFIVTRPFETSHDAAFITSTSSLNFPAFAISSGVAEDFSFSARRTFFSRELRDSEGAATGTGTQFGLPLKPLPGAVTDLSSRALLKLIMGGRPI